MVFIEALVESFGRLLGRHFGRSSKLVIPRHFGRFFGRSIGRSIGRCFGRCQEPQTGGRNNAYSETAPEPIPDLRGWGILGLFLESAHIHSNPRNEHEIKPQLLPRSPHCQNVQGRCQNKPGNGHGRRNQRRSCRQGGLQPRQERRRTRALRPLEPKRTRRPGMPGAPRRTGRVVLGQLVSPKPRGSRTGSAVFEDSSGAAPEARSSNPLHSAPTRQGRSPQGPIQTSALPATPVRPAPDATRRGMERRPSSSMMAGHHFFPGFPFFPSTASSVVRPAFGVAFST